MPSPYSLKETALARSFQNESLMGVKVNLSVVLGQSTLRIYQMLKLGRGAVIELDQHTNEPVQVLANDIPIAKGEVIVTEDGKIGVTLTELLLSRADAEKEDERTLLKKEIMMEHDVLEQEPLLEEEVVTDDLHDDFDEGL